MVINIFTNTLFVVMYDELNLVDVVLLLLPLIYNNNNNTVEPLLEGHSEIRTHLYYFYET